MTEEEEDALHLYAINFRDAHPRYSEEMWQKLKTYVDRLVAAERKPEPVAWECKAGGLKPLTQHQYEMQTANIQQHYTKIQPQRKPLTDEEIGRVCAPLGFAQLSPAEIARAVERAHGIK